MEIAIFGYGGHAREVQSHINKKVTFFVDDEYAEGEILPISKFDPKRYEIIICVAEPKEKQKIIQRLPQDTKFFTFIHSSVQLLDKNIDIGEGSFIGANCVLTTNIKIGKHVILNRANHVGHDSNIGDFSSLMPGAIISGDVIIGKSCYLGTNSTVIEKKKIVDDVKIGAGGIVVKDINEKGTYVGVPVYKIKNK
jgi:sugar O-acyltransferase (sialic acid O-acetyltransferase NeuD family)